MSIVEVTSQGLGGRTKNSIGGAIFGFVLLALGVVLLFWNEGRAVKRYQDLKEGAGKVVPVDSASVDPANDQKLVHVTGEAVTSGALSDPDFGISEKAIRLTRQVEMYQWVEKVETETKNKTGGGTETKKTYSYEKEWRTDPVDSSTFKVQEGYTNPTEMKYRSDSFVADGVTLGAFTLPQFLVKKIGGGEPLAVESVKGAPEGAKLHEGGFYFGPSPGSPQVGDLRVLFTVVRPGPVSVIAQQNGGTFVTFRAKSGGTVDLLERGILPAEQMFQMARDRNKMMTWAIRIGGYFMLAFGFSLVFAPLAVFASILPFLGRIVETGTTIIAFLLAGIVWAFVVAIAWIFYRPLLGIAILVVGAVLLFLVIKKLRAPKDSAASSSDAPPPPASAGETPPPLT